MNSFMKDIGPAEVGKINLTIIFLVRNNKNDFIRRVEKSTLKNSFKI